MYEECSPPNKQCSPQVTSLVLLGLFNTFRLIQSQSLMFSVTAKSHAIEIL